MLHALTSTDVDHFSHDSVANRPRQRLRFITGTSLFDGHDAAINIMRRIMQSQGVEVIHLGHNRSVKEIVSAAIQEDVDAIAVSSYQGGHLEFYRYLIDQLKEHDAASIKVFGGGGGVILPDEIQQLHDYGVTHIYSPEEGQKLGLVKMIEDLIHYCSKTPTSTALKKSVVTLDHLITRNEQLILAKILSQLENGTLQKELTKQLKQKAKNNKEKSVILGITGTGGAGKSSLTDELVQRFRLHYQDRLKIAIIAVDPTRKKNHGALLGDRIRMNSIDTEQVFMRSMATRESANEIPKALPYFIKAFIANDYDLIIIETPGIGQGDTGIVSLVDTCLYVMTSEYGSSTQLEKLNILDFADLVAINKFDRKGSQDALRDVQKQLQRNREQFDQSMDTMPVFGTNAAQMNDDGLNNLYRHLCDLLVDQGLARHDSQQTHIIDTKVKTNTPVIQEKRQRYLGEIAECIRDYHHTVDQQSQTARNLQYYTFTRNNLPKTSSSALDELISKTQEQIDPDCKQLLSEWYEERRYDKNTALNPDASKPLALSYKSLSGLDIPKVAFPDYHDQGDLLKWLMLENLPGHFPYTAGVFKFKRKDEEPTRMFAGEGDAFRTNRRFKYLASQSPANRLSTAFDSVTLYGCDPDERQDIFGKVGNAGVSIATLADMQVLYDGFDLCDAKTSVSMTINGPAPIILAMFFNTAIAQQLDRFKAEHKREPSKQECSHIKQRTLQTLRGTVQADILKEDQGQNTCLFSTVFSLKLMGDIQQYFIDQQIQHFYSISISGYHIAEAGANPITQLAFTLANGFTYLEAFLARGMPVNDFAHRLSFFFSSGMDPEYTVIGRVARRIWAVALREYYTADERCQKLKYHIQTSGRSLHAQAMDYNEIRTTLQALIAVYDNCNSLHTNAKDEALTTPTEQSVSKALAIQMIINKEWGLSKNENPNQGAFIINQLTDLVEEAVLMEFDRLCLRGGVLGAMETGYQRSKIQEQSMRYEAAKHDGSLPIVGVNIARSMTAETPVDNCEIARSTEQEKQNQIQRLKKFKQQHLKYAAAALEKLKQVAVQDENIFAELMDTVQVCTLGQITQALFEVGGKYRRNM